MKVAWDGPKWGREDFVSTNPDLANILGRTDLDFENFYFFHVWDLKFLDVQVPNILDFQVPTFWISRLPKIWISRLPKNPHGGRGAGDGRRAGGRTGGRAGGR